MDGIIKTNALLELIVLFYMESLNKTRSFFYVKVHEAKNASIKDIGLVNRVHLTVQFTKWSTTRKIAVQY